eukprot:3870871-Rhodomonas_salina.1
MLWLVAGARSEERSSTQARLQYSKGGSMIEEQASNEGGGLNSGARSWAERQLLKRKSSKFKHVYYKQAFIQQRVSTDYHSPSSANPDRLRHYR